jgi:hypothetical protein
MACSNADWPWGGDPAPEAVIPRQTARAYTLDMNTKPMPNQMKNGKWVVIDVPNAWREGDLFPAPRTTDREFDTQGEALAEMKRRLPKPRTIKGASAASALVRHLDVDVPIPHIFESR